MANVARKMFERFVLRGDGHIHTHTHTETHIHTIKQLFTRSMFTSRSLISHKFSRTGHSDVGTILK